MLLCMAGLLIEHPASNKGINGRLQDDIDSEKQKQEMHGLIRPEGSSSLKSQLLI